jgi:N-acetylglutamate synthase-like GNAT family acetyltransferase
MDPLRRSPADLSDLSRALAEASLPADDLAEPGRQFFRFERGGELVGFGGLERYGSDALLRSVVVLPQHRSRGEGKAITANLLAAAQEAGAGQAYLLTTTAEGFFKSLGFAVVPRDDAPPAILGTYQATTTCSSAALLRRSTAT